MKVVTIIDLYSRFMNVASLIQVLCATRRTEILVHTDQYYNHGIFEV